MPKSTIEAVNWWHSPTPSELNGATAVKITDGNTLKAVITHIGSTIFHCTQDNMRRYDLDSQNKVGPYIASITSRYKQEGHSASYMTVLSTSPLSGLAPIVGAVRCPGFPPIWANAPWGSTTVLDPSKDMATQMKGDAESLMDMLSSANAAGPASDPVPPGARVEEGDPTSTKVHPHRLSVLKGMRSPDVYLAALLR